MSLKQTPSQTVGPYFAYGLTAQQYHYNHTQVADAVMVTDTTEGERIRIKGRVFDGQGQVVNAAMIELWQANAAGRFNHPNDERQDRKLDPAFSGFGRCGTGMTADHHFAFETIKPGSSEAGKAPYISVIVFMRGLPNHAYTRVYFSDEAAANASDSTLNKVEENRRPTLIAQRHETATGIEYHFDIHMQGDQETVFFNF
jgi:protocatechuate 3,4-dioxygenase alpha subunit